MVKGRMSESKECRNLGRIESGAPRAGSAARPPGGGVEGAAAAQRSTARAAFEGASPPHYRPAATQEASFSRRSGSTMARDVEALDLPAWSRASGLSQGPQCRSVPWGRSPWGPSILRSLFGVYSHPPRAALLLASPGARTSAPGARRPACAEKVLQDTKLRRSPDALQPGAWRRTRGGRTSGHAPLFPKQGVRRPAW